MGTRICWIHGLTFTLILAYQLLTVSTLSFGKVLQTFHKLDEFILHALVHIILEFTKGKLQLCNHYHTDVIPINVLNSVVRSRTLTMESIQNHTRFGLHYTVAC